MDVYGVEAISKQEMHNENGGFILLVIWGVAISAKAVTSWFAGCALAGAAVFVALYAKE